MTCEECQMLVEDYVAGELGAGTTGAMSAHFDSCAVCRELSEEERREREVYARYLLAVQPRANVWDALEAQIKSELPASRVLRFRHRMTKIRGEMPTGYVLRIAAMLLLMVGGALIIVMFNFRDDVVPGERRDEQVVSNPVNRPGADSQAIPSADQERDAIVAESNVNQPSRSTAALTNTKDERQEQRLIVRRAGGRRVDRPAPTTKASGVGVTSKIVSEAESQHLEAIALLTCDIAARRLVSTTADSTGQYADTLKTLEVIPKPV